VAAYMANKVVYKVLSNVRIVDQNYPLNWELKAPYYVH